MIPEPLLQALTVLLVCALVVTLFALAFPVAISLFEVACSNAASPLWLKPFSLYGRWMDWWIDWKDRHR